MGILEFHNEAKYNLIVHGIFAPHTNMELWFIWIYDNSTQIFSGNIVSNKNNEWKDE